MTLHRLAALVLTLGVALAVSAQATPRIQRAFGIKYPEARGKLTVCSTCHTDTVPRVNPYGADLKKAGGDFAAIDTLDSDRDGARNLAEIRALTRPGDPRSKPGPKSKEGDAEDKPKPDSAGAVKK